MIWTHLNDVTWWDSRGTTHWNYFPSSFPSSHTHCLCVSYNESSTSFLIYKKKFNSNKLSSRDKTVNRFEQMHETLSAAIILANQVQISQRFIEAVNVVDKKKSFRHTCLNLVSRSSTSRQSTDAFTTSGVVRNGWSGARRNRTDVATYLKIGGRVSISPQLDV